MQRWYLIHTKHLGESIARNNLERQGYMVYLPEVSQTVRRQGQRCARRAPLFPRYRFLSLEEGLQSLQSVHSTLGVATVVRFGSRYAAVSREIIAGIRSREDPESGLLKVERPALQRGSLVGVTDGPLSGLEGIFEREDGHGRVVILLALPNRLNRVQFMSDQIMPGILAA